MKYTCLLVATILLFSCHSSQPATEKNTPASSSQNATPMDRNDHFSVSFISIGAGTDTQAKKQFDQYLTDYQQKNSVQLKYEIIHWGMEGEVDYCFDLSAWNLKKQVLFIAETKDLLKSSNLVRYKENAPCQEKK